MGKLYDSCQYVIAEINARGLDPFKSRGAIALETGFLISMVEPSDADDAEKIRLLREATRKVLGIEIPA
jgi:hypothetical protein